MSDAMGRRPDGPGWYWYEGEHEPEPCDVFRDTEGRLSVMFLGERVPMLVDKCVGDFTPLHPPVAAPEPVITPEMLDTIEDAILIADDNSIGAVWEWLEARRKEVKR